MDSRPDNEPMDQAVAPIPRDFAINLRAVFWQGDRDFAVRVARLCVLYEDLRIEYHGARAPAIADVDVLSAMYRQFYFIRRSLVTLIEFQGALSQINRGKWKRWVEQHKNPAIRKGWRDAIRFFNQNYKKWEAVR